MPTKCVFYEATDLDRISLRRYKSAIPPCPVTGSFHNACVVVGQKVHDKEVANWTKDDSRWPTKCECGYDLSKEWQQTFLEPLFRHPDGTLLTIKEFPPGAMWDACWDRHPEFTGPDGLSLHVRLPNGRDWCIDSRCNNCTLPNDKVHKCWIRHGTPPEITVDKNGNTCSAGAGSIMAGDYHGFLQNGFLI